MKLIITDSPRSRQSLYSGQTLWHGNELIQSIGSFRKVGICVLSSFGTNRIYGLTEVG